MQEKSCAYKAIAAVLSARSRRGAGHARGGHYEEAEGRSDNTQRKPISAGSVHGRWTGAEPNFGE
jgi:hypothetical protein